MEHSIFILANGGKDYLLGNIPPVDNDIGTGGIGGGFASQVQNGYLMINAKAGRVEVKDAHMQSIKKENKEQKVAVKTEGESLEEKSADIKKKSGQEVKPDFRFPETRKQGHNPHKGL